MGPTQAAKGLQRPESAWPGIWAWVYGEFGKRSEDTTRQGARDTWEGQGREDSPRTWPSGPWQRTPEA